MKINVKNFQELSVEELYQILRLRSEVFVVEQECIYQDMDGKDSLAVHILGIDDEKIICLLYTSPSPRDGLLSRMPSSA